MDSLKVTVLEFADRPSYVLRWNDPISGKRMFKSSGIEKGTAKRKAEANKIAGMLSKDLEQRTAKVGKRLRWDSFCELYEDEVVSGFKKTTGDKIKTVINHMNNLIGMEYLQQIDDRLVSKFLSELRKTGLSESSIDSNRRHLKAMLNWAVEQKMIPVCPSFPKIQRKKKSGKHVAMKGRPITNEEFLAMLQAVPEIVPENEVDGYIFFLRCLFASGLRLQEATELYWDRDDKLCLHYNKSGLLLLSIPGELEKGHTDRLLPAAPEFAEVLAEVPKKQREGPVFDLKGSWRWIGRRISKIGEAAGIVVNEKTDKYASAHDLRRSFGDRWAPRVKETMLMKMMRHDSIETTLRYYARLDAEALAETANDVYEQVKKDQGADAVRIPSYRPNKPR